jgi:hypothetical protein
MKPFSLNEQRAVEWLSRHLHVYLSKLDRDERRAFLSFIDEEPRYNIDLASRAFLGCKAWAQQECPYLRRTA